MGIALIGIQFGVAELILGGASSGPTYRVGGIELTTMYSPIIIGLAVLTSWTTLLVGCRWRAERSWIDRIGRMLGVYWIATGLAMLEIIQLKFALN
jgi:hypothetical protein